MKKHIEKTLGFAIMTKEDKKEGTDMHIVGRIDRKIYECITDDITTDEVIITEERIQHIVERHPNDYEQYYAYLKTVVEDPDYIIEANKPNTALILKEIKEWSRLIRNKRILYKRE